MWQTPVLVTPPTATPVTLDDAKLHLHVDHPDDDTRITQLIEAAARKIEQAGQRRLMTQTWSQTYATFADILRLQEGDVQSISSVTYYDSAGVTQTVNAADYYFLDDRLGPYVLPKPGKAWPAAAERLDAVKVTYVVGYGALPDAVPPSLRQACLLLVQFYYDNTEVKGLPMAVDSLVSSERRIVI